MPWYMHNILCYNIDWAAICVFDVLAASMINQHNYVYDYCDIPAHVFNTWYIYAFICT